MTGFPIENLVLKTMCGWGFKNANWKAALFYKRAAKLRILFKLKSVGFYLCFLGVLFLRRFAYFERDDNNENFVVLNFLKITAINRRKFQIKKLKWLTKNLQILIVNKRKFAKLTKPKTNWFCSRKTKTTRLLTNKNTFRPLTK